MNPDLNQAPQQQDEVPPVNAEEKPLTVATERTLPSRRMWIIISAIAVFVIIIVTIIVIFQFGHKVPLDVVAQSSNSSSIKKSAVVGDRVLKNNRVVTSCFSYSLPVNYTLTTVDDSAEPNNCDASVNPSDAPSGLNYIDVSPKTFRVGNDPVAKLKQILTQGGTTYSDISPVTVDGLKGAKATITSVSNDSSDALSETYVIIPAPGPNAWTIEEQPIYSYLVTAYTYSDDLQTAFDTVINSITFTSP